MPKGFEHAQKASEDIAARKAAGGGGSGRLYFRLPGDGDTGVVRFLDPRDEVVWMWAHKFDYSVNGQTRSRWIPCRDQDPETGNTIAESCPGCDRGMKRQFQIYLNVIWREAPVYARDDKGKLKKGPDNRNIVADYKDQLCTWQAGVRVFDELHSLDVAYKGITNRDFRVTRRGLQLDTTYDIFPADVDGGPQPMSPEDVEIAAEKSDFSFETTTPEFANYWDEPKRSGGSTPTTGPTAGDSPFRRKATS